MVAQATYTTAVPTQRATVPAVKRRTWLACAAVTASVAASATAACGDDEAGSASGSGGSTTTTTSATGGQAPSCGDDSPAAIGACVEQSRYESDLAFVEGERAPGQAHHVEVRDLCVDRFGEHGFEVELHDYGTGINVIGVKQGAQPERVLVSAHYDHIEGCPGADDNGTGVAGLLETARVLGSRSFDRTLVVACWDEEESGLIGSEAYAQRAAQNGEPIMAVYVYEMLGYVDSAPDTQTLPAGFSLVFPDEAQQVADNGNRGDFIAIIGDESMQQGIDLLVGYAGTFGVKALALALAADQKTNPLYGDLRRSDHAPFWDVDIPALHMTDTSNFRYAAYHCFEGDDVMDNLDHAFASNVIRATTAAAADLLGPR